MTGSHLNLKSNFSLYVETGLFLFDYDHDHDPSQPICRLSEERVKVLFLKQEIVASNMQDILDVFCFGEAVRHFSFRLHRRFRLTMITLKKIFIFAQVFCLQLWYDSTKQEKICGLQLIEETNKLSPSSVVLKVH